MLKVFDLNMSCEWDKIVASFKDYDVYWLSGYVKAFNIHGDGEPLLFYYQDEKTRGINVAMKRDIANEKKLAGLVGPETWYDFATPYGYGGWLIEGEDSEVLFKEYSDWCIKNNIVSEFVRFHPVIKNHVFSKGVYEVIPLGNTVTIDTRNKEDIWANFTSKNRNVIRKAINSGIQIKRGMSEELFESFRMIYNSTMDKDSAEKYYYFEPEFYKSILKDLKDNANIFYAELDGKIIAASIMIFANGKLNYHLSGSLREYQNLAPTNLLLYKAAEWGNENGMSSFHLGGGVGSGEDSLFKFKKAFYRLDNLPRFHIGKKIFNYDKYNELVSSRNDIPESGFFPKYRA